MVKRILFTMLIIGLAFPCTQVHVSEFANQTTNISGDCITLIDDITNNTMTINSPQQNCTVPKYNVSMFVNPRESKNHPESNITCIGNDVRQNTTNQIPSGTNKTDPISNNIYIAQSCMQNTNQSCDYGQTCTNIATNVSFTCSVYPKFNIVYNLSSGTNHINQNTNETCNCEAQHLINENLEFTMCGQSKVYSLFNYSVSSVKCANLNKDLTYDEKVNLPQFGILLNAPTKKTEHWTLTDGQSVGDADISCSCQASLQNKTDWCLALNQTPITKLWSQINIPDNYTCNTVLNGICGDNITDYCTLQEKAQGPFRFTNCINRLAIQAATQNSEITDRYNICITEKNNLSKMVDSCKESTDNNLEIISWVIGGLIIGAAILYAFINWLDKKQHERSSM